MGRSHKILSAQALELVAARFRVLGEPVRLRLLHMLQERERSVTELAEELGTTQPNVSKHLKLLQDAGLVVRRTEKNSAHYSVSDETVFDLCDVVCSRLQQQLQAQFSALDVDRRGSLKRRSR
jgi:DNA-binding transcriptional ArsR family regulator